MALPAFAAVRRAAAAPAVQQSIDISVYTPGPQQQTRRTLLQRANGTDKRTDTRSFYIHPVPHTMRAVRSTSWMYTTVYSQGQGRI